MPRGRGIKRKATTVAATTEILPEPTVDRPASNSVKDFDKIIRDSNIVSTQEVQTTTCLNMASGCGGSSSLAGLNMTRCTSDEVFAHVQIQIREKKLERPIH
ncbi:hypothetical protein DPMN_163301 [Dreissena polymorpha]|uniref:Uncharacterized protein n=1 Tax=Dreissena polymorpha TaxID=45954 RepID=A0A9D4EVI2_DREPO|nr:hypothetical protein DPMN_163301 [Dreissena polymorpha]